MITGSFVSSYYGEPRATRDLDIIIDPEPASLETLVVGLQVVGFYVDRDAAREALPTRTQFSVAGMLTVAGDAIDRTYLTRWIVALGLTDTWERVSR